MRSDPSINRVQTGSCHCAGDGAGSDGEFKEAEGTGMGEGTGAKDVSDQIEDQDQLLGAKQKDVPPVDEQAQQVWIDTECCPQSDFWSFEFYMTTHKNSKNLGPDQLLIVLQKEFDGEVPEADRQDELAFGSCYLLTFLHHSVGGLRCAHIVRCPSQEFGPE